MSATVTSITTIHPKEFHFPLAVGWTGGRRVSAQVEGKPSISVAPPIVFSGDDAATWSPEDFFVAAAASCLAVTFTGIAERAGLEYDDLVVAADGVCGQRPDGRFASPASPSGSSSRRPTRMTTATRASWPSVPRTPVSSRRLWTSRSRQTS